MHDVDPQLMLLREAEAKLLILAVRLEEVEQELAELDREAVSRPEQEQRRQLIFQSLEAMRLHRALIVKTIESIGLLESNSSKLIGL